MTHVFIVDDITFKYHLEYMFAGTGAREKQSPFIIDSSYRNQRNSGQGITSQTESGLVGMISDISKVRPGDKIIFYLQATQNHQGMFFGVFKAIQPAFFDNADANNYLYNDLKKYLTYRILIEPDSVYESGITEHEYLDSLENITSPHELCWSLIYRKLKGNRGCTTIFDYEYTSLLNKLILKNNNQTLAGQNFTYNANSHRIQPIETSHAYQGEQHSLTIRDRLEFKSQNGYAFESHLQCHIIQNIDTTLRQLLLPLPKQQYWLGNEVSCGVGMQRIDLLLIQETNDTVFIKVIELKDEEPQPYIIESQLKWYIEWLHYYVLPNYRDKQIKVIPCVIANGNPTQEFLNAMDNAHYIINCEPVEYISLDVPTLTFTKYN